MRCGAWAWTIASRDTGACCGNFSRGPSGWVGFFTQPNSAPHDDVTALGSHKALGPIYNALAGARGCAADRVTSEADNGKNDLSPVGCARLRSSSELLLVDKLDISRRSGINHDAWRNRF